MKRRRRHAPREGLPLFEGARVEVVLHGRDKQLTVTGVVRILEYGEERMRFLMKKGELLLEGHDLACTLYTSGAIGIFGRLSTLSFLEGKELEREEGRK